MSCTVFQLAQRESHLSQLARTANQNIERDCFPAGRIRSGGLKPLRLSTSVATSSLDGSSGSDVESLSESSDALSLFSSSSFSASPSATEDEARVYTNPLAIQTTTTIDDTDVLKVPSDNKGFAIPACPLSPLFHEMIKSAPVATTSKPKMDYLTVPTFVPGSPIPAKEPPAPNYFAATPVEKPVSYVFQVEQGFLAAPFDFHGPAPPRWPHSPPMTSILAAVDPISLRDLEGPDAGLASEDILECMRLYYGGSGFDEDAFLDEKPRGLKAGLKGVKKWVGHKFEKLRGRKH
jgi:hypothetical protein